MTQKLHIFAASLAEISLPACAMLCCFCLSSSLGFSFAGGFRLFLLVALVLLVGIFTLCLLLVRVVFTVQLQLLAAVDLLVTPGPSW